MSTTIVIADTVDHAKTIARTRVQPGTLAASPRSIRLGFGRGIIANQILVDDSAWPLPADVRAAIEPCCASAAIYRLRRNAHVTKA